MNTDKSRISLLCEARPRLLFMYDVGCTFRIHSSAERPEARPALFLEAWHLSGVIPTIVHLCLSRLPSCKRDHTTARLATVTSLW